MSNWKEGKKVRKVRKGKKVGKAKGYLDCGRTFPTNKNMALSDGSWMRFLMIHINCATVMSFGTKNFLLSISWMLLFAAFSTTTCKKDKDFFLRLQIFFM